MMENGDHLHGSPPIHVLLCPDQPSWAFDNIATNIARFAGPNKISKIYMQDVIGNETKFFQTLFLKRIDLCHIFWREDLFYLLHPQTIDKSAQQMGLDYETLVRAINSCAFTTSIYDHLFSSSVDIQQRRAGFAMVDGYTVSSEKLQAIYAAEPEIPTPDRVISDGIDIAHFHPSESDRTGSHAAIGWVGNSAWGRESLSLDVKGYHRLFQPMMDELGARGHAVQAKVADPQINRIRFEDMPDFYRQIDVFVCTSSMEGTPNPVLEAMACGIPVVSTDVGIVSEVFGDLQKPFIIKQPAVQEFANAVEELLGNKRLYRQIATQNRLQALDWSWEIKTKDWWPFWEGVMLRTMDPRNAIRREIYLRSQAQNP